MRQLVSILLLLALSGAARAHQAAPKAPAIPSGVNDAERVALARDAQLVADGKFDQAAAGLKTLLPDAVVPVYVDWAPVPKASRAAYRQAAAQAVQAWNTGLNGAVKFALADRDDGAGLRILFERAVAETRNGQALLRCIAGGVELPTEGKTGPAATSRQATVRIALDVPYSQDPHTEASMTHLFAQAIGLYLGLTPVDSAAEVMGPDTHTAAVCQRPATQDLLRAVELQRVRVALMGFARHRVAAAIPRARLAFDREEIDAGAVSRGEMAHYVFTVKNAGDAPLEIDARPTCGCTVARFDHVVAPGRSGRIEADINTSGFRGPIMKLLEVASNDPARAQVMLRMAANVESVVQIVPADTLLVPLKDGAPTVREIEVRAGGKEPVTVTRVACTVPYASARVEPMAATDSSAGKGRAYKVTLTIQPDAPVGRSAFLVSVFTSSPREPQVNITAICDKGILAIPASLYVGSIDAAAVGTLPLTRVITLMRSEGAFHIRGITSDDPKLTVTSEAVQEGKQYRLTIRYGGGWPAGAVRSKITVETDDPHQARIEIPVTASVIAAGAAAPAAGGR